MDSARVDPHRRSARPAFQKLKEDDVTITEVEIAPAVFIAPPFSIMELTKLFKMNGDKSETNLPEIRKIIDIFKNSIESS